MTIGGGGAPFRLVHPRVFPQPTPGSPRAMEQKRGPEGLDWMSPLKGQPCSDRLVTLRTVKGELSRGDTPFQVEPPCALSPRLDFFLSFFKLIYFNWRLIALQYCRGSFCSHAPSLGQGSEGCSGKEWLEARWVSALNRRSVRRDPPKDASRQLVRWRKSGFKDKQTLLQVLSLLLNICGPWAGVSFSEP